MTQGITWNYHSPHLPQVLTIYQDYRQIPGDWSSHWSLRRIGFYVGSQLMTPAEAGEYLANKCKMVTWVFPFHWKNIIAQVIGAPEEFSKAGIQAQWEMMALARKLLKDNWKGTPQAAERVLDECDHNFDLEADGPAGGSAFQRHLATGCYLLAEGLRRCSWDQRRGAIACNYATSVLPQHIEAGRVSVYHVPGAFNADCVNFSGYWSGGPHGCFTEAEVKHAIDTYPRPMVLELEDYNPGLFDLIRYAKKQGVNRVVLWGHGFSEGVGSSHREIDKGGDPEWVKKMDDNIAAAFAA